MIYTDSESVKNFQLLKIYVIYIGSLGGALEPFLGFRSFSSWAPPRGRRTYRGGRIVTVLKMIRRNWWNSFIFIDRNRWNSFMFLIGSIETVSFLESVLMKQFQFSVWS